MATFGPFQRIVHIPNLIKTTRTWYRQKPVTASPLPYTLAVLERRAHTGYPDLTTFYGWAVTTLDDASVSALKAQIYQKAYGRLIANISAVQSQLGADIGERKQAYTSMLARVGQLTRAARYLRAGRVNDFVSSLGLYTSKRRRSIRSTASDLGGVWLEFSYGWVPLVKDIYSATQVLQQPLPNRVVKGKAQGKLAIYTPTDSYYYFDSTEYAWHLRCLLQMRISISNEWAWQANQLGLINPLSIAWELVPFSFVVDWFLPIGKFLSSLTDFVGLNVTDSFNTWYGTVDRDVHHWNKVFSHEYDFVRKDRRADLKRLLSLPSPPELSSRFTGFYSVRGANAIALLCSVLKDLPNVKRGVPNKGRSLYV